MLFESLNCVQLILRFIWSLTTSVCRGSGAFGGCCHTDSVFSGHALFEIEQKVGRGMAHQPVQLLLTDYPELCGKQNPLHFQSYHFETLGRQLND